MNYPILQSNSKADLKRNSPRKTKNVCNLTLLVSTDNSIDLEPLKNCIMFIKSKITWNPGKAAHRSNPSQAAALVRLWRKKVYRAQQSLERW